MVPAFSCCSATVSRSKWSLCSAKAGKGVQFLCFSHPAKALVTWLLWLVCWHSWVSQDYNNQRDSSWKQTDWNTIPFFLWKKPVSSSWSFSLRGSSQFSHTPRGYRGVLRNIGPVLTLGLDTACWYLSEKSFGYLSRALIFATVTQRTYPVCLLWGQLGLLSWSHRTIYIGILSKPWPEGSHFRLARNKVLTEIPSFRTLTGLGIPSTNIKNKSGCLDNHKDSGGKKS